MTGARTAVFVVPSFKCRLDCEVCREGVQQLRVSYEHIHSEPEQLRWRSRPAHAAVDWDPCPSQLSCTNCTTKRGKVLGPSHLLLQYSDSKVQLFEKVLSSPATRSC